MVTGSSWFHGSMPRKSQRRQCSTSTTLGCSGIKKLNKARSRKQVLNTASGKLLLDVEVKSGAVFALLAFHRIKRSFDCAKSFNGNAVSSSVNHSLQDCS